MTQIIQKTENKTVTWNANLRSRVGDSVSHNSKEYTNTTGKNSEPGVGVDWFQTSVDGVSPTESDSKTLSTKTYESYGDSITAGQGATAGNDYTELFSDLYDLTNTNRAIGGRGIQKSAQLHNANINPIDNTLTSLLVGLNDVRRGGNGVKTMSKITNGYKAIICNQFLDRFLDTSIVDSNLVLSGTWINYNSASVGGKNFGKYSQVSGNYMEYTFKDSNLVLAMICSDGVAQVHGSFDVSIDGGAAVSYSLNNKTDGISDGADSNTLSPFILYFEGLEDKEHTIRVTHTDTNNLPINYFGHLKQPKFCSPIIMLETARLNAAGYATAPSNASDLIINELNTELNNVVGLFNDSYPIFIVKTNDFYDIDNVGVDNVHPNDIGYRQIYNSVYDAFKVVIDLKAESILQLDNTFEGENTFEEKTKINNGLEISGTFSPAPTGEGIEIDYNSGIAYFTAFKRIGAIWKDIIIRGKDVIIQSSGVAKATFKTNTVNIVIPTYSDDTAAGVGGLIADDMYKTVTGEVRIKI